MTRRRPTRLPPPTTAERAQAAEAARRLRSFLADPSLGGERIRVHIDTARPRRGLWMTRWANLPGFHHVMGQGYAHDLLPGWAYTGDEVRAELIPDLERLAATGERPTEATR